MRSLFDRLRNPTYTGERRCWPCTVLNAILLFLACVGVARRRSREIATLLGIGGAAAIALRGYLVPYTPRFAPRLAARLPGDPFDAAHRTRTARPPRTTTDGETPDAPEASGSLGGEADEETGERVLSALLERGVVVAESETIYLDEEFRAAWRAEVRSLRDRDDDYLATTLEAAAPEGLVAEAVEPLDEVWFVVSDGSDDPAREQWLTRSVAVADAAAARALADRTDLSPDLRAQATGPLRTFLESCPVCDGPVEETTAMECCGGPGGARADAPDEVLACADCGVRLYTFQ